MHERMPRRAAPVAASILAALLALAGVPAAHAEPSTPAPETGPGAAASAPTTAPASARAPEGGAPAPGPLGAPPAAAPALEAGTAAPPAGQGAVDVDISARIPTKAKTARPWHLLGIYELHYNLVSDDHGANDWYTWYMVQGKLDLSRHDQVGVRLEMIQRYILDDGESGFWPGDARMYYWRKFSVPLAKLGLPGPLRDMVIPGTAAGYLTLPFSRESRARSYVTRPTVTASLAPSYGPATLILTGIYRYSFARYAESEEADPNQRQALALQFQLLYQPLPWFSPSFTWQSWWDASYPSREGTAQGWRGSEYYFELAATFTPALAKLPGLDVSLTYAQGAPMIRDGVYRFAFAKRDQSELYLAVNYTY